MTQFPRIDAFDTLMDPLPPAPPTPAPARKRGLAKTAPAAPPVTPDDPELFRQSFSIYERQLAFLRETAMRIKLRYPRADVDQGTIVRALLDVGMDVFERSDLTGVRSERTLTDAMFRTLGPAE